MSNNKRIELLRSVYELVKPYGRKKLFLVFAVNLLQGLLQVVGVTSILPFLAMAADPEGFRESSLGIVILSKLPEMDNRELLMATGIFAMMLLVSANAVLLVGELVRVRYAQSLGHWMRMQLIARISQNSYAYFLQRNTGELLKKMIGDVKQMVDSVLLPLLDATGRVFSVLFLLSTLFVLNPFISAAAILALGGFYGASFSFLNLRRQRTSAALKAANRGSMREAQQFLGGIKAIKATNSEPFFMDRFSEHSLKLSLMQRWIPFYQNSPRYLIEPLLFGGLLAAVVLIAARGEDLMSILPQLGVMAFAGYRILPNLQLLYGAASQIGMMAHSVEEVHEELKEAGVIKCKSSGNSVYIEQLDWHQELTFDKVSYRYEGSKRSLFEKLSVNISKNQFVAFVGQTGSGKSTLVDLLLGLHLPSKGQILVDKTVLAGDRLHEWRASVGYVPQDIFLTDDTISANIAFGVPAADVDLVRVREVASVAQIAEFIENELQEAYSTHVGERGVRLSGGQRQRIGLARALYRRPTTLILDEATSALDNETEAALMKAINDLQGQMTIIAIAHRLSTIERADKVYKLCNGKVVFEGDPFELANAESLINRDGEVSEFD